jgi:hypothetical protein
VVVVVVVGVGVGDGWWCVKVVWCGGGGVMVGLSARS